MRDLEKVLDTVAAPLKRSKTARLSSFLINKFSFIILLGSCIILLSSCNPEQEVELELPQYESELVVECYLEPGEPFQLLLTESVAYFGEFDGIEDILPAIVDDATVVITHNDISDTLLFDPSDIIELATDSIPFDNWFNGRQKVQNFRSPTGIVPTDYTSDFHLHIIDGQGREVTATTRLLPPIEQDTLEIEWNSAGTEALVRGRWQDDPSQANWYRWAQHKIRRSGRLGYQFNFILDDRVGNGEEYIVSSFYDYESGDSILATLFHIDQAYADYINTTDEAEDSNGNPFAQPGSIISNVEGGIGIFTALSYTQKTVKIP